MCNPFNAILFLFVAIVISILYDHSQQSSTHAPIPQVEDKYPELFKEYKESIKSHSHNFLSRVPESTWKKIADPNGVVPIVLEPLLWFLGKPKPKPRVKSVDSEGLEETNSKTDQESPTEEGKKYPEEYPGHTRFVTTSHHSSSSYRGCCDIYEFIATYRIKYADNSAEGEKNEKSEENEKSEIAVKSFKNYCENIPEEVEITGGTGIFSGAKGYIDVVDKEKGIYHIHFA